MIGIKANPVTSGDSCFIQYSIVNPDTVLILFYKDANGNTVIPDSTFLPIKFGNCSVYCPTEKKYINV